jgi:Kef-type K+ transport system membrane component KefB
VTKKSVGRRVIQLGALASVTGLLLLAGRFVPVSNSSAGLAAALGLLLLAGVLCSEILDLFGLPHLTGYLAAGALAGPQVLAFINHDTVEELSAVNTLALALIALAGGLELRISTLREVARSLAWSTLVQSTLVLAVTTGVFFALAPYISFTRGLSSMTVLGIALLWGVLAVSRSPSATLGIISQARPAGPLTRYSVSFVMLSDIVVVLMMAAAMVVARPLIIPGSGFSISTIFDLGRELYGSIAVGTTLGILLALYLRLVGRHLILALLFLGFGLSEGVRYLHLDPLLTFITAGFIVQNTSDCGDRLLHAIEETGAVVFVVFFATAGAHLDLRLLAQIWPIALTLAATRGAVTILGQRISSRWAGDGPLLKRWGWSSLISQAGLTLGLSVVVEAAFPALGSSFRSLVIATVGINEVVGPIVFKLALDRAGETGAGARPGEAPDSH